MNELFAQLGAISWAGNSLLQFAQAGLVFVVIIIVLKIFQLFVLSRVRKFTKNTDNSWDDAVISVIDNIGMSVYVLIALYFALGYLRLPPLVNQGVSVIISIAILYEIAKLANRVVGFGVSLYLDRATDEKENKAHAKAMLRFLQGGVTAIIWVIGLLLILSNIGIDVTSLVASLGIGGLAIALALQNVFSDLFSSFSLFVDKPFEVGDTITVGTQTGKVQRIGLKTTRIKMLRGEELVVSNRELTNAQVQNMARLKRRREVQTIGVAYETDQKKLESIPALVEGIVSGKDGVTFSRCHFASYGDFSLNFEIVYFIESADYNTYMDIKQAINFDLFAAFTKEKIEFAYPTQVVHVKK